MHKRLQIGGSRLEVAASRRHANVPLLIGLTDKPGSMGTQGWLFLSWCRSGCNLYCRSLLGYPLVVHPTLNAESTQISVLIKSQ
jgi:hypothetical protein